MMNSYDSLSFMRELLALLQKNKISFVSKEILTKVLKEYSNKDNDYVSYLNNALEYFNDYYLFDDDAYYFYIYMEEDKTKFILDNMKLDNRMLLDNIINEYKINDKMILSQYEFISLLLAIKSNDGISMLPNSYRRDLYEFMLTGNNSEVYKDIINVNETAYQKDDDYENKLRTYIDNLYHTLRNYLTINNKLATYDKETDSFFIKISDSEKEDIINIYDIKLIKDMEFICSMLGNDFSRENRKALKK